MKGWPNFKYVFFAGFSYLEITLKFFCMNVMTLSTSSYWFSCKMYERASWPASWLVEGTYKKSSNELYDTGLGDYDETEIIRYEMIS